MIRRIELRNFMSHAHSVIEPAAGLTVLVGPNNCGKSAVVAALQILCDNDKSTYVMRHGEKACSILVETDDGHTIEWRRRKSPSYLLDGKECSRKLSDPQFYSELHEVLRLPRVDGGGDADFDVHFGTQKTPIFLLGSSPANAAKFFASSSDAIRLVEMQKRHKEKQKQANQEKNRLEAESRHLTRELELLEPTVEIEQRVKLLEQLSSELAQLVEQIEAAARLEQNAIAQERTVRQKKLQAASFTQLAPPPTLHDTAKLELLAGSLETWQKRAADAKQQTKSLASLESPPPQHDVATLPLVVHKLRSSRQLLERKTAQQAALASLPSPPALSPVEPLAQLITRLQTTSQAQAFISARHQAIAKTEPIPTLEPEAELRSFLLRIESADRLAETKRRASERLSQLAPVPATADTSVMESLAKQLAAAEQQSQKCREQHEAATRELAAVAQQLREFAAEQACPTCGAPLDADRLVAQAALGVGGHSHG